MAAPAELVRNFFLAFYAAFGIIAILAILAYAFWLWMFLHAIFRRRVLWAVLLLLAAFTGVLPGILAVVYYFAAYRKAPHRKR